MVEGLGVVGSGSVDAGRGLLVAGMPPKSWTLFTTMRSSPNSFHSSICSRSYTNVESVPCQSEAKA